MSSNIEWTDETWNPITGCSKISPACDHCYAERMANRLAGRYGYPADDPFRVTFHPDRLEEPLRWRKPRKVFVVSMGDLFHEDVKFDWIEQVMEIARESWRHTYLVLTKRPQRVLDYWQWRRNVWLGGHMTSAWPENVWLGVTVENQEQADKRIPVLLDTPAAKRFVSCEPLLGPVSLTSYLYFYPSDEGLNEAARLDWVIAGGESGTGARPSNPEWFRLLLGQCQAAGVPFFFKQWGEWGDEDSIERTGLAENGWWEDEYGAPVKEWTGPMLNGVELAGMRPRVYKVGKKAAGHLLDGRAWREFPS